MVCFSKKSAVAEIDFDLESAYNALLAFKLAGTDALSVGQSVDAAYNSSKVQEVCDHSMCEELNIIYKDYTTLVTKLRKDLTTLTVTLQTEVKAYQEAETQVEVITTQKVTMEKRIEFIRLQINTIVTKEKTIKSCSP